MSDTNSPRSDIFLNEAILAYKNGALQKARLLAIRSILFNPGREAGWVILAAVSPPEKAIAYLRKALSINPSSEYARNGLDWAEKTGLPVQSPKQKSETATTNEPEEEKDFSWISLLFNRILTSISILLIIAFITLLSLYLAKLGQQRIPLNLVETIKEVFRQMGQFLFDHPETYFWSKENVPAFKLVSKFFINSSGLLLISLLFATLIGSILGIFAARLKHRNLAPGIILVSILGISLPSFLIAMLLWVLNFKSYQWLGLKSALLPPTGFGWDLHVIMPALVLAARPLAQIAQITYVAVSDVLREDFIRTASAKGMSQGMVIRRHVYRNILIPVLTTLGTSLRFSLASLPIVESFFLWPGVGLSILQAIAANMNYLVTDLILALGFFFLLINYGLDFLYAIIDPRLRTSRNARSTADQGFDIKPGPISDTLKGIWNDTRGWLKLHLGKDKEEDQDIPLIKPANVKISTIYEAPAHEKISNAKLIFRNFPLLLGTLLALFLVGLILFGKDFAQHNPSETNTMLIIEGKIQTPPFEPSSVFPWGSDLMGRDIQALVLAGASQTLTLALVATIARVLFGTLLGVISGWWSKSWMDRFIQGMSSVWVAFPETVFAMLIILALGIQKGRSVFIIALCLVGWTEITQFVRSQVIAQKPKLHIEAARSLGSRPRQILIRHIFPHLVPSILVLFALQMGGILMLLAELGFLNIFLGGGFLANITEGAGMTPINFYFSDIPEWGALLANIRDWWRSYPWLAWYPGVFFFIAIFTFNIWGEGLRRLIQETRINLNRLFNRYTVSVLLVGALLLTIILRSTTPMSEYKEQALLFDTQKAMAHIQELTSPEYQGRRSGSVAERMVAEYIQGQMEEIGLFPGASNTDFIQTFTQTLPNLDRIPTMRITDENIPNPPAFNYQENYSEFVFRGSGFGTVETNIVAIVSSSTNTEVYEQKSYRDIDYSLQDKIVLIREEDLRNIYFNEIAGLVIITNNDDSIQKHYNYAKSPFINRGTGFPIVQVNSTMGEFLLSTCNSSLQDLKNLADSTPANEIAATEIGAELYIDVPGYFTSAENSEHYNVLGYIPGTGANQQGSGGAMTADQQVIIISAYYDGLGKDPKSGDYYQGANDNASGVAMMLEIARAMKNGPYKPEKTVLFIAWSPGERQEGLSIVSITEATNAFNSSPFEAVFELSGVGGGSGNAIALDQGSSYKLVTLFQKAGQRTDTKITTRGKGPHTDIPIRSGFGERTALTAYVSWDGSDEYAHTLGDTYEKINEEALNKTGETVLLVATLISREQEY